MRRFWRGQKPEGATGTALMVIEVPVEELASDVAGTGTDLVVFEIPADELFEEDDERPGRVRRLLAGIGHVARRVNPAARIDVALRRAGGAVRSVVVKIPVRRLAAIVRKFQKAVAGLDPVQVGDTVRRFVDGINSHGKHRGRGRWSKALRSALAAIGPKEAGRIAKEATSAIKHLVAQLDPDSIGDWFRGPAEAARAASGEDHSRLVRLLAQLTDKAKLVLKELVRNARPCDVLLVLLVVVKTVPALRAFPWLVKLLGVLYTVLCNPISRPAPAPSG